MIELLLATGLSCASSQELIDRVNAYALRNTMPAAHIQEIIDVIKEDNPECFNEGSKPNP